MSLQGTVKCVNDAKGFGFIIQQDGTDLFFHATEFKRGVPEKGTTCTYDLGVSPTNGQPVGVNVQGSHLAGSVMGTVDSFVNKSGYGFLMYNGQQVFVHLSDVKGGGLVKGDTVYFDLEASKKDANKMVAKNVTGGSGHTERGRDAYSKGKGKGYGGFDENMMYAFMSMMGKAMGKSSYSSSPYGKGSSKGAGKSSPSGGTSSPGMGNQMGGQKGGVMGNPMANSMGNLMIGW